ncbi:PREDICTED: oxidative stress-induced growth inhibitor 2-like [Nicrophorus vespilloides]|uniref:Oxidative stress-induced growth inhibitor 2-like n=1 Tax=Nicrophorus vespilloides TaxID=110193 RepID=A0ABM1NFK6_NICVS|nr:PREDICTED: oxidative stress-induced growth inhibitor 2-like [Nicrophorus vespilloides]
MDPQILTLSLGSWMSLPGLRYEPRDGSEKRASAKHVAEYYVRYVQEMGLQENFENGVIVTRIRPCCEPTSNCNSIPEGGCTKGKWVEKVNSDICQKVKLCSRPEPKEKQSAKRKCALANAFNYLMSRSSATTSSSSSAAKNDLVTYRDRSKSCDSLRVPNFNCSNSSSKNNNNNSSTLMICDRKRSPKWYVECFDLKTRTVRAYSCDNLVLANGSSDLPNRLSVEQTDPYWLTHDSRSLEIELDLYTRESRNRTVDPVVIVGAGLSAADAIIATRSKGIPVAHVFRGTSTNLSRQLPENMYPEYHKVHQMMKEDSTYPLYDALPEHSLVGFDEVRRLVRLRSNDGKIVDLKVSFVAVLIGSKPDLSFLPDAYNIATKKHLPLDCKRNTVNIDRIRHSVNGFDALYAMGPLAGDNFVRFLPGGALAILSDLHRKRRDAIVK